MINEDNINLKVEILANGISDVDGYIRRTNDDIFYHVVDGANASSGSFSVASLDSAHIQSTTRESNSTFVWVGLSVVLGLCFFFMIENTLLQLTLMGISGLMGLYLLYDHFSQPNGLQVVLCTKSSEIRLKIFGHGRGKELSESLNNIIVTNGHPLDHNPVTKRTFAPR